MGGVLAVELSMACSLSIASALSVTQAQTLQPTPERATDHAPPDASSTLARSQYFRSLSRRHSVTILCRQFTVKWRVNCFDVVRTTVHQSHNRSNARATERFAWRARRAERSVNTVRNNRGAPAHRAISQRSHNRPARAFNTCLDLLNTYSNAVRRRRGFLSCAVGLATTEVR
jgi:hypothetical protein